MATDAGAGCLKRCQMMRRDCRIGDDHKVAAGKLRTGDLIDTPDQAAANGDVIGAVVKPDGQGGTIYHNDNDLFNRKMTVKGAQHRRHGGGG